MRNNRPVTDLKYNTKKRLISMRRKANEMAAEWGDIDFFVMENLEHDLISKIDEIIEIVDGVDVKSH